MKKNLIITVIAVLIFIHVIPPYNISSANEEINECENMNFTVQTIVENDKKITGKGLSGQSLDLEFITTKKQDTVRIDENGDFVYNLKTDELARNDKIIISNDYYEIETEVAGEETPIEQIKSKQYVECPVEKTIEEPEESTDEATPAATETEEQLEESADEATPAVTETEEEPEESVDEATPAATETEKQLEESVNEATPAEIEIEEQPEESVNEATPVEIEIEEQPEESADEETPAEIEMEEQPEESADEETPAENEIEEESEKSIAETFSVLSPNQIEATYQSAAAPIDEIQGSSVTVSTGQEFINALINNDVEYIRLSNNITTSGTLAVRARYEQKIIDANGYSINFGSGQMELSSSGTLNRDVRNFFILNATNLYSSNASNNGGLIKKTTDEVSVHLENVRFNANNNTSGGILGSSWEGNINFYGNNLINTYNGDYSMVFRKVFVHQSANLEINNYNGRSVFQFESNSRSYGDNEYGIQVDSGASVNVNSNAAVITTDLVKFLVTNRILTNRFGVDSNVTLSGRGTNIFIVDNDVNNFITDPQSVDFINTQSNGVLFNNSEDINFFLSETTLKGWNRNNTSNQPSNISQPISTGEFRFSGNNTTNVSLTPQQSNFSTMFPPQLRRMAFEESIPPIEVLEVAEITDITTEITGMTSPNVSVIMSDENGNVIQTVESNSNGEFIFVLEEPYEADTLLRFQAQNGNVESHILEETVSGNRLELIDVPDVIPFESTEIQDEEIVIERENPKMTVSVMDTRSSSDWHLTAKALAPLTDPEGNNPLNEALYYVEDNSEEIIEDEAVKVGEKNQSSDSNVQELSWGAGEGILLKLNPIEAQADTEYSTTIEWTLTDGPQ